MKILALVIAEDSTDGTGMVQHYIGNDLMKILKKIIEDHSYPTSSKKLGKILKHIDNVNGDGCDFIFAIIINNELLYSCTKVDIINVDEDDSPIVDNFFDPASTF
jgi:hypothetical protein